MYLLQTILYLLFIPSFVLTFTDLLTRDRDYGLATPDLIRDRGFIYELHHVTSPDGFILAIHRIVNPLKPVIRFPVLLFHGLTGTSENFLNSDKTGFISESVISGNTGFELAKQGYDVWLTDQRATPFSSNNTFYNRKQKEYWDWSVDEIALLDLPLIIEYIRGFTGRHKIGYVGHSQGTQIMFMLMSREQKYNHIIEPFIALAPVFYLTDTIFEISIERLIPWHTIEIISKKIGGRFTDSTINYVTDILCGNPGVRDAVCKPAAYVYLSFQNFLVDPVITDLNFMRLPVYATSSLWYTVSSRQLAHNLQTIRTHVPRMLDYSEIDPAINKKLYGTTTAPKYEARLITCKSIALISATGDVLATPSDRQTLVRTLGRKPLYDIVINDRSFGHTTFIFGSTDQLVQRVVKPVLMILGQFD